MAEFQLTLNEEEREALVTMLEAKHREQLVEEHRTRKLAYREHVMHAESVVQSILAKLASSAATV